MAQIEEEAPSSPLPPAPKIIVIKRKKGGGHGGHHGGAWKVAYADFVTAMMALFMVLWLMNADVKVQEAVASFFNNPKGPGKLTGTAAAGSGNAITLPKDDMAKLGEKIRQALLSVPNIANLKDHIEMSVTSDGLRIELVETEAGMFFESGRPVPTPTGTALLTRLAEELGKLPNDVLLEGHTDAKPFSSDGTYSNWELSTDRANSVRRLMQEHGLRPEQVAQVRGYADRQLRHPEAPDSAANRRITVIVQYLTAPPEPVAEAQAKSKGEAGEAAKPVDAKKPAGPLKPVEKPAEAKKPAEAPKPVSPVKK